MKGVHVADTQPIAYCSGLQALEAWLQQRAICMKGDLHIQYCQPLSEHLATTWHREMQCKRMDTWQYCAFVLVPPTVEIQCGVLA
jgi:hypothetical protein